MFLFFVAAGWLCIDNFIKHRENMFKVVKTIENGCQLYSDVPSSWEVNNNLMWPVFSSRDKGADKKLNQMKKKLAPPQSNWSRILCEVKGNYQTLEEARDAAKSFSTMKDTEDEER